MNAGEPNRSPPYSLLLYNDLLCLCSSMALEYEMPLNTVWIQSNPLDVEDAARTLAVISVERTLLVRTNSEHERLAFINNAHSKISKLLGQPEIGFTPFSSPPIRNPPSHDYFCVLLTKQTTSEPSSIPL